MYGCLSFSSFVSVRVINSSFGLKTFHFRALNRKFFTQLDLDDFIFLHGEHKKSLVHFRLVESDIAFAHWGSAVLQWQTVNANANAAKTATKKKNGTKKRRIERAHFHISDDDNNIHQALLWCNNRTIIPRSVASFIEWKEEEEWKKAPSKKKIASFHSTIVEFYVEKSSDIEVDSGEGDGALYECSVIWQEQRCLQSHFGCRIFGLSMTSFRSICYESIWTSYHHFNRWAWTYFSVRFFLIIFIFRSDTNRIFCYTWSTFWPKISSNKCDD